MEPIQLSQQPPPLLPVKYCIRGTMGVAMTILFGVLPFLAFSEANQYDTDGETGTGSVVSVQTVQTRTRRTRTTRYRLTVHSPHGQLIVSSDDSVPVGAVIRYIYSPSLGDARLVDGTTERGDILSGELHDWKIYLLLLLCPFFAWYAYDEFKWSYILIAKKYVVVPE